MSAVAHIKEYKTGRFYSDDFRGASSWNGYESNVLLRNEGPDEAGQPRFVDVALALGAADDGDARGLAVADWDNDGDLDLAINHNPGASGQLERARPTLLRNDVGNRRRFLSVDLQGTRSNRDGVGALVTVEAGGRRQMQVVGAGSSYASQQSLRLHFGLGQAAQVDALGVRWPGGATERFENLPADSRVLVREGAGLKIQDTHAGRPGGGPEPRAAVPVSAPAEP